MTFDIKPAEFEWLGKTHSKLVLTEGKTSIINGVLEFDMVYHKDHYIINPDISLDYSNRIKDAYEIEIKFENILPSSLPQVKETAGRIKKVKEKYQKRFLADVHMYPNETLCLCAYPEEKKKLTNGFNLKDFFELLLIPFFYAQSYYEKHEIWIWGERSHGPPGLLESYVDNRGDGNNVKIIKEYIKDISQLRGSDSYMSMLFDRNKIKGHWLCFCGSQLKLRNCHQIAFQGLWHLKEDILENIKFLQKKLQIIQKHRLSQI